MNINININSNLLPLQKIEADDLIPPAHVLPNVSQKVEIIAQQIFQESTSSSQASVISKKRVKQEENFIDQTSPATKKKRQLDTEFSEVTLEHADFNSHYKTAPNYSFTVKIGEHTYTLQGMGVDRSNIMRGVGSWGRVFLGTDENGKKVAIKVANSRENGRSKLEMEGHLLLKMRGKEHVLGAEACGIFDNKLFIVMNHIDGCDFYDLLKEKHASGKQKVQILLDIAKGLKECHEAGILHRDIKQENIMVEELEQSDGSIKYKAYLIDFGLSAMAESRPKSAVGTRAFMAPEVILQKEQTFAADIFSFGQLIHEVLIEKSAFTTDFSNRQRWREPFGDIVMGLLTIMQKGWSLDVANLWRNLIEYCLKWNPNERPDIQIVVNTLESILNQMD